MMPPTRMQTVNKPFTACAGRDCRLAGVAGNGDLAEAGDAGGRGVGAGGGVGSLGICVDYISLVSSVRLERSEFEITEA